MRQDSERKKIAQAGIFGALMGGLIGFLSGNHIQLATSTAKKILLQSSISLVSNQTVKIYTNFTDFTNFSSHILFSFYQHLLVYNAAVKAAIAIGAESSEATLAGGVAVGKFYTGTPVVTAVVNAAARSTWLGTLGIYLGSNPLAAATTGALMGLAGGTFIVWSFYRLYEFLRTDQSRELDRLLARLNTEEKILRTEIKSVLRGNPKTQYTLLKEVKLNHLQHAYSTENYLEPDDDTPPEFVCPITLFIMKNPVKIHESHTFEKNAISLWYHKNTEKTCPLDRRLITQDPESLPTDEKLKSKIEEYVRTQRSFGL